MTWRSDMLWSAVFVRARHSLPGTQVTMTHGLHSRGAAAGRLSAATTTGPYVPGQSASAATAVAMRAGRHFARFTMRRGEDMLFGLVRPGFDVDGGALAEDVVGHCFYDVGNGDLWPGPRSWEGQEDWQGDGEEGDTIGMLLDFDDGTLTIFRDDERLGVMARGLSGEYCWAVPYGTAGCAERRTGWTRGRVCGPRRIHDGVGCRDAAGMVPEDWDADRGPDRHLWDEAPRPHDDHLGELPDGRSHRHVRLDYAARLRSDSQTGRCKSRG